MKKTLLFLGAVLTSVTSLNAQSLQTDSRTVINDMPTAEMGRRANTNKTVSCGPDTVYYPLQKATAIGIIGINNATSATSMAQYFNCPQPITLSGTDFFAFKADETGGITIDVGVSVYLAGADSLPMGSPIVSTLVTVDTVFADGLLTQLVKHANFTPTSVSQPYCVVVSNNSANGVSVLTSSYTAADGAGEWLGSAQIGATWLHGYELNVGVPYDADALFLPYATYDLTASFTQATDCIGDNGAGVWTNTSSPVLGDRMYNLATYLGLEDLSSTWNYGDGSAEEQMVDGAHTYSSTAPWTVTLTDTLYGWGVANCVDATSMSTGDPVSGVDMAIPGNGSGIQTFNFTGIASGSNITSWSWDFGDGNSSAMQNPTHTYSVPNSYTVCLTVTNDCGSDQYCGTANANTVTGIADAIQQNLSVYPNPSEGNITLELKGFESQSTINIFDVAGRNVLSEQVFISNDFRKNINLDVDAGTYMLQLVTEEGIATKKLQIH